MLTKAKALTAYRLESLDGRIGKVREFYFDDRHWTIRYLAADTGYWLPGRQVLISPYALVTLNKDIFDPQIIINLTKAQIEGSPSLDTDRPVSRQYEQAFHSYYYYPIYWGGPLSWGAWPFIQRNRERWKEPPTNEKTWDPHLRSTSAVTGHHVHALDGRIGHLEDFIIDDDTWTIRYLVVSTHDWWPGRKVLVSPQWIERVSWDERTVFINLDRDSIKRSPEYAGEFLPSREYELALHAHYQRPGYWIDDLAAV